MIWLIWSIHSISKKNLEQIYLLYNFFKNLNFTVIRKIWFLKTNWQPFLKSMKSYCIRDFIQNSYIKQPLQAKNLLCIFKVVSLFKNTGHPRWCGDGTKGGRESQRDFFVLIPWCEELSKTVYRNWILRTAM